MYSSSLLEESFLLAESDVRKLARTNNIARKIKDVSAVFETLKKTHAGIQSSVFDHERTARQPV